MSTVADECGEIAGDIRRARNRAGFGAKPSIEERGTKAPSSLRNYGSALRSGARVTTESMSAIALTMNRAVIGVPS